MANVEEMIKNSKCFGVAYDPKVKECKICEVYLKCKTKCELGRGQVEDTKPADVDIDTDKDEISMSEEAAAKSAAKEAAAEKAPKKKKEKAVKEEKQYDASMPDISSMDVDSLLELAVERGGNADDFNKYSNDNIKKMRLKMFIKKTYEV